MRTHVNRWLIRLTLAVACQLGWNWAAAAAPLIRVAQVVAQGTAVTAYLDLRDSDGRVLAGVTAAQLGATLGAHPAVVNALLPVADTGEGIAYIFLVDVSRSLTSAQFALLKSALGDWVAGLRPVDRAALVTFGKGVHLVEDFTADAGLLTAAVDRLAATDLQTFFHQGLLTALTLGQRRDAGLPERRAIVTLTDGIDDVAGGVSADEVYAQLREGRIPLYAIGFASGRDRAKRDAGLNALGQLARRSGGSFRDASGGDLADAYRALRQQIAEQYRARIACAACVADGSLSRLQLVLTQGGATVAADLDVRLHAAPEEPTDETGATPDTGAGGAPGEGKPAAEPEKPDGSGEPATPAPESPETPAGTDTPVTGPPTDTPAKTDPATPPEESAPARVLGLPPWIWAAVGGGLLLLALLLGLLARRRATAAAAAEAEAAAEALAAAQAVSPAPVHTELSPAEAAPQRAPAPPPGPTLHLAVVSGQHPGQRLSLVLDSPKTIGRATGCDLTLANDPEVSQRHCRLRLSGQHLLIEDLGSTNRTRVNGVPIEAAYALADGDLLGIGRTELRLVWKRSPE